MPLSERLEKLKTVLIPLEGRIQFSAKVEVTTKYVRCSFHGEAVVTLVNPLLPGGMYVHAVAVVD